MNEDKEKLEKEYRAIETFPNATVKLIHHIPSDDMPSNEEEAIKKISENPSSYAERTETDIDYGDEAYTDEVYLEEVKEDERLQVEINFDVFRGEKITIELDEEDSKFVKRCLDEGKDAQLFFLNYEA
ncbi:MAG: hypothetical protein ACTSPB_20910 [Candidatus Thorarchaeota archaeon]